MAGILAKLRSFIFPDRQEERDPVTRYLLLTILAAGLVAVLAYWFYNHTHTFDSYRIRAGAELNDVEGTQYRMLSDRLVKYGHDGLFCVDLRNNTLWSSAYTMQTPIADVCGGVMAIAEQQGSQVYVLNAKGILGSFTTDLPVMKIRAAANGVVALVLNDTDDTTWIRLMSEEGAQIATVRATQAESGYPVDIALASDARQLLVSYVGVTGGELTGRVALYDFSSASDPDASHLIAMKEYPGTIFPDVYFAGKAPVAVADDGFIAFSSGRSMEEKARMTMTGEAVSVFYDSNSIGFISRSGRSDVKYHMAVYNYRGRLTMESDFDFSYSDVWMEDGEILMYDASALYVFRTSGRQKLAAAYERPVRFFARHGGMRSYLVVTAGSIDRIRIY